jgi:hypothetical protein
LLAFQHLVVGRCTSGHAQMYCVPFVRLISDPVSTVAASLIDWTITIIMDRIGICRDLLNCGFLRMCVLIRAKDEVESEGPLHSCQSSGILNTRKQRFLVAWCQVRGLTSG